MRPLALALLLAAGCQATPRWHVARGFLRSPDGRAAILRGVNLSGTQKNPPYLAFDDPADWSRLRGEFGFNAVRFVMPWAAVEPQPGQYDDHYLDEVAARLQWARQDNLAVVVDLHQDIYGEGFGFDGAPRWTCDAAHYAAFKPASPWFLSALDPNVEACWDNFYAGPDIPDRFVAMWRHVAERLASSQAVVGFEVLNEPEWGTYSIGTFESDRLQPLYERVVKAVRQAAPDWVAFLEPSASRNAGLPTGLLPFDFRDVVYAPHSYDQGAESGNGFDPSHRQKILDNVQALAGEARSLSAALWIGEYGGVATAPNIVDYMDAQYDAAAAVAASSMYWDYSKSTNGYGLLDDSGAEKPLLADTLARPYPERVAGDPVSWNWEETTSTFTFTYAPDRGSKLSTDLSVPPRRYPNGYVVDCGGCATDETPGVLRLLSPPPGNPATVTLRPKP